MFGIDGFVIVVAIALLPIALLPGTRQGILEEMGFAEMELTDAIVDLENTIDVRPPRFEGQRILRQIKLLDGADRKLDDARRTYNQSAAVLNRSLKHPFGRAVGGMCAGSDQQFRRQLGRIYPLRRYRSNGREKS